MGLFLSLSGIVGSPSTEVKDGLKSYAQNKSGGFEIAEGTTDNPDIGVITRDGKNTSILYPRGFMNWDECSQYLSKILSKPVFSFHIHDGDFWMYLLFNRGQEADCYSPLPEYWGEISAEEKEKWRGNAQVIASVVPDVFSESISKYLVEWDPMQEKQEKAYPDDEFHMLDCWQICDFIKKIGLQYPMTDEGLILGDTFRLWTNDCPLEGTYTDEKDESSKIIKRPWWKFW